jgi:hypothetical protein
MWFALQHGRITEAAQCAVVGRRLVDAESATARSVRSSTGQRPYGRGAASPRSGAICSL